MSDELKKSGYQAPSMALIGTVQQLTLQNIPASGQDDASFLNSPGVEYGS
jgi:hypothetical protein